MGVYGSFEKGGTWHDVQPMATTIRREHRAQLAPTPCFRTCIDTMLPHLYRHHASAPV